MMYRQFQDFHVGHHVGQHLDHLADMMADMKPKNGDLQPVCLRTFPHSTDAGKTSSRQAKSKAPLPGFARLCGEMGWGEGLG